jgi:hypothetical protein
MRFMVIVKASKDSEKEGALPDPKGIADMNKFNDELLEAGVLIGYDGLHPSSKGAPCRIRWTYSEGTAKQRPEKFLGRFVEFR